MANQAPFEILVGPAKIYLAAVGVAFPAPGLAPSGSWTYLGDTEGGITAQHNQNILMLRTDQNTGPQKGIRIEEGLVLTFAMAQLTYERLKKAMNDVATTDEVVTAINTRRLPLHFGPDVARFALLAKDLPSPYGAFTQQYEIRYVIPTGSPQALWQRDDKTIFGVEFTAIEDSGAPDDGQKFGVMRAQYS